MSKWILGPALAAVAVGGFIAAPAAFAESKKHVDKITCEEFLAMDPNNQNRIAFWVDGYYSAKNDVAIDAVAFDKFGQPIGALVDDCKASPKATLWKKIKGHF